MRCRFILPFIILCIATTKILAQTSQKVVTIFLNPDDSLPDIKYRREHPDIVSAGKELRFFIKKLRKNGYPEASADSVFERSDTLFADVHLGSRYIWERLDQENPDDVLAQAVGFQGEKYIGKPFDAEELEILREQTLTFAENNGYPFASVHIDSLVLDNGKAKATMRIRSGPFITFDSVKMVGKVRLKKNFLIRYTDIVPGKPFDSRKVVEAEKFLQVLPYLRLIQPPAVLFEKGKAQVEFPAEEVKAGQINGIIGFMPNEQDPGKILLTGDVFLRLENMFNAGKKAEIRWQRLKKASQLLNLEYVHPFLFGSALDLNIHFNLLKEDTLFLNINRELGFRYRVPRFGYVTFHGRYKTSRLITSSLYENALELPKFSDTDLFSSGLGWIKEHTNNPSFPRKGYSIGTEFSAGSRTIRRNAFLPQSFYEGVSLKSAQFALRLRTDIYMPVSKNLTILTRLAGGKMIGKNLFSNELFRIGGLKSLRGFNENHFFASEYITATAECRIYGQENAYLAFFYDQGYVRNINYDKEFPFGFGAALGVATKAGIFSLVWAFGQSEDQPLNINRSKIHFGITGQF